MVQLPKELKDELLIGVRSCECFAQKLKVRSRVVRKGRWTQDRPLFETIRCTKDGFILQPRKCASTSSQVFPE